MGIKRGRKRKRVSWRIEEFKRSERGKFPYVLDGKSKNCFRHDFGYPISR